METTLTLADSYFEMLKSASNETKLRLIRKLTDSMLSTSADVDNRTARLERLFGAWTEGSSAEEIIDKIYSSRTSGKPRHIISLNE